MIENSCEPLNHGEMGEKKQKKLSTATGWISTKCYKQASMVPEDES